MKSIAVFFVACLAVATASVIPQEETDIQGRCLLNLGVRLWEVKYNSPAASIAFAKDILETLQSYNELRKQCQALEVENPSFIEELKHRACTLRLSAQLTFDTWRLKAEAERLREEDFWVNLVIGLVNCFKQELEEYRDYVTDPAERARVEELLAYGRKQIN